jgi:polyisoprenoid-binding protein YceI
MTATATVATRLPAGTWKADTTHSSATFAVKHMAAGTFRGGFENLDAALVVADDGAASLQGTVRADSIDVKDENLRGHLGSPEFFDTERYPELSFRSDSLQQTDDGLAVEGELTIKGNTQPLQAHGSISGPSIGIDGSQKLGLTLETTVDRTLYGLNWNAPLPKGGFALANDVKLTVELELTLEEQE